MLLLILISLMMLRYMTKLATPTTLVGCSFATTVTRDRLNYYSVLELESSATQDAIKAAYA